MNPKPDLLSEAAAAVARVVPSIGSVGTMSDEVLLTASGAIAEARRELDSRAGWVASEIGRRSRREFGYDGLAQRQGFRTPEALIQSITGTSRADAATLVRIGTMVAEAAAADSSDAPDSPGVDATRWCAGIARAVSAGTLSYPRADAIRVGLGDPTDGVTADLLSDAADVLIDAASNADVPMTVEELRRLARQLRDSIDAEGLSEREKQQQDAQYVRAWKRADGMVGGSLLLDRENGAYFLSVLDELTSPRRGGPRFVDQRDRSRAEQMLEDARTTDRIAADGVMQLLRIGTAADANQVYGSRKPAVRIVVTRDMLASADQAGAPAFVQDTGENLSVAAVERNICETGSVTVTLDARGRPLDLGRDRRLFTARQKVALAVRDGGCVMAGCDRPPSWTEAHHIDHFVEHHGSTDTADGVLLCRHHHLMLHNNGWRIIRDQHRYFLRRSRVDDPEQTLIPLRSKNPVTLATAARTHARRSRAG